MRVEVITWGSRRGNGYIQSQHCPSVWCWVPHWKVPSYGSKKTLNMGQKIPSVWVKKDPRYGVGSRLTLLMKLVATDTWTIILKVTVGLLSCIKLYLGDGCCNRYDIKFLPINSKYIRYLYTWHLVSRTRYLVSTWTNSKYMRPGCLLWDVWCHLGHPPFLPAASIIRSLMSTLVSSSQIEM